MLDALLTRRSPGDQKGLHYERSHGRGKCRGFAEGSSFRCTRGVTLTSIVYLTTIDLSAADSRVRRPRATGISAAGTSTMRTMAAVLWQLLAENLP